MAYFPQKSLGLWGVLNPGIPLRCFEHQGHLTESDDVTVQQGLTLNPPLVEEGSVGAGEVVEHKLFILVENGGVFG